MLGSFNVSSTLAVKDLEQAKEFYGDLLGLQVAREGPYAVTFRSGDSLVEVYFSEYAGTNKATAATWEVEDVQGTADALKDKGMTFEHYDMEGMVRNGDVHMMDNELAAWFKDPDGNILCLHAGAPV